MSNAPQQNQGLTRNEQSASQSLNTRQEQNRQNVNFQQQQAGNMPGQSAAKNRSGQFNSANQEKSQQIDARRGIESANEEANIERSEGESSIRDNRNRKSSSL